MCLLGCKYGNWDVSMVTHTRNVLTGDVSMVTHTNKALFGHRDIVYGVGWAIIEKWTSANEPASMRSTFPPPPSSAGVPNTVTWEPSVWWRRDMETRSVLLAICEGNPLMTAVDLPQRTVIRALFCSLLLTWTRCETNNRRWFETPWR